MVARAHASFTGPKGSAVDGVVVVRVGAVASLAISNLINVNAIEAYLVDTLDDGFCHHLVPVVCCQRNVERIAKQNRRC